MSTKAAGASHVPGARRRRAAFAAMLAGALLLGAAGVLWWQSRPAPDIGSAAVERLATPAPAGSPAPASERDAAAATPIPRSAATLPAPVPATAPVRLVVPSIRVDATVVPTGVDDRGDFAVPPSVDTVGWYRYGPGLEAGAGSIVIGGHVDSATQGRGAFFRLRELTPGQRLTVTGSDGRTREFRVVARETYRKTAIDLDRYFAVDGAPRLTLITCGGPFDERTGHYRDNVVVTAVPAG
jgi:sortase family protein